MTRCSLLALLVLAACADDPAPRPLARDTTASAPPTVDAALAREAAPCVERVGLAADEPEPPAPRVVLEASMRSEGQQRAAPDPAHAGVLVEFGYRDGADGAALVSVGSSRTDAAGSARVEFEVPRTAERLWYWARPVDEGWRQVLRFRRADPRLTQRLMLSARRGATMRGVLVDAAGAPVSGFLSLEASRGGRWGGDAGADGAFELHFAVPGDHELSVLSPAGTAVTPLALDPARPPQDLRVTVAGPGTLAGRVVDDAGEPHADLALLALERDASELSTSSMMWPKYVRPGGRHHATVSTDADGAFRVAGLAEGEYRVLAAPLRRGRFDVSLTDAPLATGTEDALLRIEIPLARVRVLGSDRQALPFSRGLGEWTLAKRVERMVVVWRGDGSSVATGSIGYDPWRPTSDPLRWDLALERDAHYVVTLITRGGSAVSAALYVDPDGRAPALDLSEPRQSGAGRVRLAVRAPRVAVLGKLCPLDGFAFELRTQASETLVIERALELAGTFEAELPPGAYVLDVEPSCEFLMCGTGTTPDDFEVLPRPHRRTLTVLSGGTLDVNVELEPAAAAYLRVALPEGWSAAAPEVRVLARRGGGEERALGFRGEGMFDDLDDLDFLDDDPGLEEPDPTDSIRPGSWEVALDVLEPGEWSFRAEAEGFVGESVVVTLRHGECRRVELALEAK